MTMVGFEPGNTYNAQLGPMVFIYCKWKNKIYINVFLKKKATLIRVRQNERTDKTTLLLSSVLLRYFVRVFIELKVLRVKVGHEQLLIGLLYSKSEANITDEKHRYTF